MRLRTRIRYVWRRARRFVTYRILHVDDTPHRIALGVAIGIFIAWTPTPGFQMLLIFTLAWLLRANKVVGLPMAWLSNPLTVGVYVFAYWVGCMMLGMEGNEARVARELGAALAWDVGWVDRAVDFFRALGEAFVPLLAGCLLLGAVSAVIMYVVTYKAVVAVRRRRAAHRAATAPTKRPPTAPAES